METRAIRTAFITGATSGIGKAFAERLAHDGYNLVLTGRRAEILQTLAADLSSAYGVTIEPVLAELSNDKDVEALVRKVQGLSDLALLVNNAGFGTLGLFHEESAETQTAMVKCHVLAPVLLMHAAIPNMLRAGGGAIINVSSVRAFGPGIRTAVYAGAKSFLNSISQSVALELQGTGVKVQVLCPGYTTTDFHNRLGLETSGKNRGLVRWMSPEEVVDISLRCLAKDKIVCLPNLWNKALALLLKFSPLSVVKRWAQGTGGSKVR